MTRTTTALRDVAHQPALFTIFTNNRGQIGGLRRPDPVARHRPSPGGRHRVEKGLTPEQVNKAGAVFRAEESKDLSAEASGTGCQTAPTERWEGG